MIGYLARTLGVLQILALVLFTIASCNLFGAADVLAQTLRRDATGAVVPCQWLDESAGAYTRCTTVGPLPVTTGDVGQANDPFGWGKAWRQPWGNVTPVQTAAYVGSTLYGFTGTGTQVGGVGFFFEMITSYDGGRTWSANGGRWSIRPDVGFSTTFDLIAVDATNARVLIATQSGDFVATSPTTNVVEFTVSTGLTGEFRTDVDVQDLVCQGGTCVIHALQGPATTTQRVCRSTNGGQTWGSCQNLAASTGSAGTWGHRLASPAAGIWLALDTAGRVYRSSDDAVTWSNVATLADGIGSVSGLVCLSSTICVAHRDSQLSRSTDAGATWTTSVNLDRVVNGSATTFGGFVNFGNGIATLMVATPTDFNTISGMRTTDFGQSWSPLELTVVTGTAAQPGNQIRPASVSDGRAFYLTRNGDSAIVNVKIPPGATMLFTPDGASGAVNQGIGAAATAPWSQRLSDGTQFIGGAAATPLIARLSDGTALLGTGLVPLRNTSIQGDTLLNSQTTGAANTAVVVTIAAASSTRGHLYRVDARCSAGTSSVTVESPSGTTIWSTAAGEVGTTNLFSGWNPGLTGATNTAIVITLATCGVGNTGTLIVQGDRF